MLPVMGGSVVTAPKIIRVHSPVGMRCVDFSYRKRGTPPVFPTIGIDTPTRIDGKTGDRFVSGDLSIVNDIGGAEDSVDWSVAGTYYYAQSDVRGSGSNFQCGRHPYKTVRLDSSVLAAIGASGGAAAAFAATAIDVKSFTSLPSGLKASSASSIDFSDPNYKYADQTELASAFGSESLII